MAWGDGWAEFLLGWFPAIQWKQKLERQQKRVVMALGAVVLLWLACIAANAQSVACPVDMVCITPQAAIKALQDSDTVKAQKDEIKVKDTAIDDLKKEVAKMQIELAKTTGELTGAQESLVQDRQIITVLLQNSKKRCGAVSILCL